MLTKNDLIEALQLIHQKLDKLEQGQINLEQRLIKLEQRQKDLELGFNKLNIAQKNLELRQIALEHRQKSLELKQDSLQQEFREVKTKLDQSIEDNAIFFNEAGIFFDKMRSLLERRIEKIENHLGLPH